MSHLQAAGLYSLLQFLFQNQGGQKKRRRHRNSLIGPDRARDEPRGRLIRQHVAEREAQARVDDDRVPAPVAAAHAEEARGEGRRARPRGFAEPHGRAVLVAEEERGVARGDGEVEAPVVPRGAVERVGVPGGVRARRVQQRVPPPVGHVQAPLRDLARLRLVGEVAPEPPGRADARRAGPPPAPQVHAGPLRLPRRRGARAPDQARRVVPQLELRVAQLENQILLEGHALAGPVRRRVPPVPGVLRPRAAAAGRPARDRVEGRPQVAVELRVVAQQLERRQEDLRDVAAQLIRVELRDLCGSQPVRRVHPTILH